MAIVTTYTITLERYGDTLDITDRVTGGDVAQIVTLGQMGTGSASVTVNNHDGEFTPGNGGTYDVDLFGYALIIEATITTTRYGTRTAELFHGLVVGFDLADNGVNSTVRLDAADVFTVAGRAPVDASINIPGGTQIFLSLATASDAILNGFTTGGTEYLPAVPFPDFGAPTPTIAWYVNATDAPSWTATILEGLTEVAASDVLNNTLMPSGPGVAYPTTLEIDASPRAFYYVADRHLIKDSGTALNDRREFGFSEDFGSVFDLPFRDLVRGYSTDAMTNTAQIKRAAAGAVTQTATDSASVTKYGTRGRQYSEVVNTSDTAALNTANLWANRTSTPRFVARSLTVTAGMVREKCADEYAGSTWEDLLDMRTGQWNPATITYTPTGGTSTTEAVMVAGRRIMFTPSDTTVTLDLLPLADYAALVLDDDLLGLLDTDRLG